MDLLVRPHNSVSKGSLKEGVDAQYDFLQNGRSSQCWRDKRACMIELL